MAHKTLNEIAATAKKIEEGVTTLSRDLPGVIQENMKEVISGCPDDIEAIPDEDLVAARNEIQTQKAILQGKSNLIQKRLDENKLERKLFNMKPEDIANAKAVHAEMIQAKEDFFMRTQAAKKAAEDKKIAAKAKKAAAAEKKAAGGKKRKASQEDPEVAAIESEMDEAMARIEAGDFAIAEPIDHPMI